MKRYFLGLLACVLAAAILTGCEKDENQVIYEGGTAPSLSSSRTGTIPLSFANASQEAFTLSWTNPNYRFTTGVSSQGVNYQIEIDTVGADFKNPKKRTISVSQELSRAFTQAEFNDILLNTLELQASVPHQIEVRVKSFLGTNAAMLVSNTLKLTATPYPIPPKVTPYSNRVFIVGNATPGGWNNPVPTPAQELTQVTPTLYTITLALTGGGSYLFLPTNGSWSQKYGFDGSNNANNPDGGDFIREGGDILAPAVSGTYKIELNFQTGKFKATKL